jgi:hypothetical protein
VAKLSKAEYREFLAAADAPEQVPQRLAASVAPLVGDLRPALRAAAEQEPQRAARLEQEVAPTLLKLSPVPAARSAPRA